MNAIDLKRLRKDHSLTQKALGEMLGYGSNYISRLERGDEKITPRFEKLVRLAIGKKKAKKSP